LLKNTKNLIGSYDYMFQAVDDINTRFKIMLYSNNISKVLNGTGKSSKGFIFKYKDDKCQ